MSDDPLRNLRALRHKLGHHSARLDLLHAGALACRRGCDGCCQTERSVNAVEFRALEEAAAPLSPETRQRLSGQIEADHCSLLLDGACALYADRPLICRSQGYPLAIEEQRVVCPLNLEGVDLADLPDEAVLSVDALSAILVAVNHLYCQEEDQDPQQKRAVGELFSQPA